MVAVSDIGSIEVEQVELRSDDQYRVAFVLTLTDGSTVRHQHTFPAWALAARAGEYGIDPADTARLIAILIAEPFLPQRPAGETIFTAPTWRAGVDAHLKQVGELHDQVGFADLGDRLPDVDTGPPPLEAVGPVPDGLVPLVALATRTVAAERVRVRRERREGDRSSHPSSPVPIAVPLARVRPAGDTR